MEVKQTKLPKIIKGLATIVLLITSVNLYAQNEIVLGAKFDVEANFTVKDSTLIISYENKLAFSQLIWANDFSIAAICSPSDISWPYLASPIIHEIYLIDKNIKTHKTSNSFFLRNDSTELNFYNYKFLNPNEKLEIKIKIDNDDLFKSIVKKSFVLKGIFSFVDFTNVELYASRNKINAKNWASLLANYTQKPNPSTTLNPIILKDIPWQFNRKQEVMTVNGASGGLIQQGRLSKSKLIYPFAPSKSKFAIFSFEELYRFSNKQNFEVKINLK